MSIESELSEAAQTSLMAQAPHGSIAKEVPLQLWRRWWRGSIVVARRLLHDRLLRLLDERLLLGMWMIEYGGVGGCTASHFLLIVRRDSARVSLPEPVR